MKKIVKILTASITLLFSTMSYGQQSNSTLKSKKVLIVVTSAAKAENTGHVSGLWIEEFATPYYMLKDAGVTITIASPKGGVSPIDPRSTTPAYSTEATKRFYADAEAQKALNTTLLINDINPKDYDAVYYPGGHGPMWDMPENQYSIKIIESMYRAGKPISFVCHAPVALRNVKAKDGSFLLKGKKIAGFSNDEELTGKTQEDVPYLLEDMLRGRGANYVSGPNWKPLVVQDGLLISGQNPASSGGVAEKLMAALTAVPKAKK